MIKTKPFILITNDDGVHAPGILHLWRALKDFADIVVVAPSNEQSAVGLSITVRHPLRIEQMRWPISEAQVWAVSGTPSDCVKLALNIILPARPHLIVSGINRGANSGRNILYSGTVAAVIEGILHDIPGIAFSHSNYQNPCFESVERYIPQIVRYVLEHPLPTGTFLNVNFPENYNKEAGFNVRMTRQGKSFFAENPEKRNHPSEGHAYYWLGTKVAHFEEEDSDIFWLKQGFATAVPIHIGELTDRVHVERHRAHFEEFINKQSC